MITSASIPDNRKILHKENVGAIAIYRPSQNNQKQLLNIKYIYDTNFENLPLISPVTIYDVEGGQGGKSLKLPLSEYVCIMYFKNPIYNKKLQSHEDHKILYMTNKGLFPYLEIENIAFKNLTVNQLNIILK